MMMMLTHIRHRCLFRNVAHAQKKNSQLTTRAALETGEKMDEGTTCHTKIMHLVYGRATHVTEIVHLVRGQKATHVTSEKADAFHKLYVLKRSEVVPPTIPPETRKRHVRRPLEVVHPKDQDVTQITASELVPAPSFWLASGLESELVAELSSELPSSIRRWAR